MFNFIQLRFFCKIAGNVFGLGEGGV